MNKGRPVKVAPLLYNGVTIKAAYFKYAAFITKNRIIYGNQIDKLSGWADSYLSKASRISWRPTSEISLALA